ncbi:hypothetical protein Vadar_007707 [Vaccinium darrowii]|uniref:Uncharacterized protein n=1 Tax=Vaccinium darrowii TaxID=229202 RepID=A0ACB7Y5G4_9ERIC|nr:hypothetical protein Vadar_007707 [Vaccinium darrowii]
MEPDKNTKGSAGNTIVRRSKRQKVSATKDLHLAPKCPIPDSKSTKSRVNFSTGMAKQIFLKQVKEGLNNNFVLSPISMDLLLGMVASGLCGTALERTLTLLGAQDIHEIKSSASAIMAAFAGGGGRSDKGGDDLVLCMVNGAWVDKQFPLVDSYKEDVLKGIYDCDAQTVDFVEQANEVAKQINLWAEDASKGLITDLLQPDKLSPLTTIVLANGLYFKGIWAHKHKFDASLTKKRNFHLLTGDTISVPFMKSCERYHYRSFDTFKVLKIPYQSANPDRKFSMYFFLPHENVGLEHLFEELYSDSVFLKQDFFNLSMKSFDEVLIPKFKFSYEFDVSRTMEEMGMTFSFTENPEDVSGVMEMPEGVQFLDPIMIQKVVINVDEKGTEAAVVTRSQLATTAGRCSPPKLSFVADHPFMFMIREEISELVFFTGAVLNPCL